MPDSIWNDLPAIPDADSLECRAVLAAYGLAMAKVQQFEFVLKAVLNSHRMIPGRARSPVDDAALERMLLGMDKATMGQALRDLRDHLASLQPPVVLPGLDSAAFDSLVDTRNFLAHRYLFIRAGLIRMPEAHDLLIAELRHYARMFALTSQTFTKWLEKLLPAFGLTKDVADVIAEKIEPELQALERAGLDAFREQLRAMGAIE